MRRRLISTVLLFQAIVAIASAQAPVDYLRDIKPLLRERCVSCHGGLKQNGKLRLDTVALLKKGGKSGPAIHAADADHSPLLVRVSAKDDSERMPPEGPPLTAAQVALLRAWIVQGAVAPTSETAERDAAEHWAFKAPQRPELPTVAGTNAGNPIDGFIGAELARRGLTPRPGADRTLLLRRVTLDLTGLPPTPDELHAFLADEASDAYEKVVARLLESPQHGERWARHWMDVWRYSDWYGRRMVPDVWNSAPQVWRWRDWIVRSLNADKGYDRMVQEMLAGDEVAPEDDEAGIATAYLIRNWYALNPNDWMRQNVEHTTKAFLGLTFNCAHCHDHKYDPISHDDYFRLRAFFEPIGIRQDRVPGEADPGPFQEYSYSTLRKIVRLGSVRVFDKNPAAPTWFYSGGDERNRVKDKGSLPPAVPAFLGRADVRPVKLPLIAAQPGLRTAIRETIRQDAETAVRLAEANLESTRKLAVSGMPAQHRRIGFAVAELMAGGTQPGVSCLAAVGENARGVYSSVRMAEGLQSARSAAHAKLRAARAELVSVSARIAASEAVGRAGDDRAIKFAVEAACLAEWQSRLAAAEAAVLTLEDDVLGAEAVLSGDSKDRAALAVTRKKLGEARQTLDKLREALPPKTYTPLGPSYPTESTGRRRALAEWITGRDNPLAARVAVNHIWMRHFHAPLVASVFDFGRNGAAPTHPELLDWLAVELMESGWSMKHLHRLIVTSDAYRRVSSTGSSEAARMDPENRLLWRMNTGRMESEVVRDSLLACAGRLDFTMGGQEIENDRTPATFRRSLYYSCYPENGGKSEFGALFDAPDAGECYRRTRTVMPQQALALTNSELVHQTSEAVAKSLLAGPARSPREFITAAYERVLAREPTEAEYKVCVEYLEARLAADGKARESLVRALFNHNDFVSIR